MEDIFYAASIAIIVGAVAAHSFIWTWFWLRKRGAIQPDAKRLAALESRVAILEEDNRALELEIERIGESQRFRINRPPQPLGQDLPLNAE
jgi:hypothetical protein